MWPSFSSNDMKQLDEWSALHDVIIDSICVTWPGAVATIVLTSAEWAKLEIVATGVTTLSCPQHYPWGRARYLYINEARLSKSPDGSMTVEIETQGGDVIVLAAATIALEGGGTDQAG
jgi:hypothetical protein